MRAIVISVSLFVHSVVALNKSHIVRGVHCFPLGFAAQGRDILGKMAKNYMKIAKSTFWGEIGKVLEKATECSNEILAPKKNYIFEMSNV